MALAALGQERGGVVVVVVVAEKGETNKKSSG
jgi:hypothetical protein